MGRPSATQAATATVGGTPNSAAHVVLLAHGHGGHDAAETLGPGGQQQAPDEGVDGGAAGERIARQVAVDGGERGQVGQHEEECGHGLERLGEAGRGRPCLGEGCGAGDGGRLGLQVGHRCPGHQAGRSHGQVLVPSAEVQVAQRGAGGGVLHDDHPPALPVATARGEAGRVEQSSQHFVVDGLGMELAGRAGAAQGMEEVQVHGRPTVASDGRPG